MQSSAKCILAIGVGFVAAAGCGQYLGYRVEGTREISRDKRVVKRGEPRELKLEILKRDAASSSVVVQVNAVCEDQVAEAVVTEEKRVHKYTKYDPFNDLFGEPFCWVVGVVIGILASPIEGDAHFLCAWPPFDLIARVCGGYGVNEIRKEGEGAPHYEAHPPSYPRRVAQWLGWVLPGYSLLGDGTREKSELVRRERLENRRRTRRDSRPAQARVQVRASTAYACALEAQTDAQGRAVFDLSRQLNRTCRGRRMTLTAQATWRGLKAAAEKTFDAEELGVTWDKPRFRPVAPPDLVVSTQFRDANGNDMLDANEAATFTMALHNRGRGEAFQIKVAPEIQGSPERVRFEPNHEILVESIPPGEEKRLEFRLQAEEEVPAQLVRIRFEFDEINGFEPEPVLLSFHTRPYDPPKLVIAKWSLDDDQEGMSYGNGDRKLDLGEQAEITLFVQNQGNGEARGVSVELASRDANVTARTLAGDLGDIAPGKWAKAVFTVMVNRRYKGKDTLPLALHVAEARKKFSSDARLDVTVGKAYQAEEHVVAIAGQETQGEVALAPVPELKQKKRKPLSQVDFSKGEHYALLVGIEDYVDDAIGDLSYSVDDVTALRESLVNGGMFKADNIFLMTDGAANSKDRPTRVNVLLTLKWLVENLKPEDTLLFAFSGHGDTEGAENYLVPIDGRLALPQDTSIRLKRVLEWLGKCRARRQVVMLDACHSGLDARKKSKGLGGLAKAFEKDLDAARVEGRAVLSSCSKGEVAYEDSKLGHGVFTSEVLEGLNGAADSDHDGQVTVHELNVYVHSRVLRWCRDNRKSPTQTPRARLDDTAGAIVLMRK